MTDQANDEVIQRTEPKLDSARIEAFRRAVGATSEGLPPTFATAFRATEFQWLDRTHVDMRQLLHTEQRYEFVEPLQAGDVPVVSTRVLSLKERAGMKFFSLETRTECDGRLKIVATTTFVVRVGKAAT